MHSTSRRAIGDKDAQATIPTSYTKDLNEILVLLTGRRFLVSHQATQATRK